MMTTVSSGGLSQAPTQTTASSNFAFSFGATPSIPTISNPSTTLPQPATSLAPLSAAPPTSGFSFAGGTPSSSGNAAPLTSAQSAGIPTSSIPTLPTGTTGVGPAAASAVTAPSINFRQLQDFINKWTIDVEEQERDFIEQATKVNYWDKTLMANGDKITKMNEAVDKVKLEHSRMEHSLDFVRNAQKDVEGFVESLESALPRHIPPDPERVHMYALAENMDTELQQMAEDLKEIIGHINESNKLVDRTDPVSQILRILNEHTDSLQWLEDQSNAMKTVLEEVTQMHQVFRRDHERSLKLMFKYN